MHKSLILLPLFLAGCTMTATGEEPGAPIGGKCRGEGLESFIGQTVTADLGAAALAKSGARSLRWIAPDTAVTMDFREDRLNIRYDRDNKVLGADCG